MTSISRIAFATNFCPHYRVKTFEILAAYHPVEYYFFSEGNEWYWQREHGVRSGSFNYVYLPGFDIAQTRISPALPVKLWRGNYDIYIKCIDGKFALISSFLVARLRRRPFILWTGIWMRLQTGFHRLLFPITRYIYLHSDAVVAYGEHIKRYLISEGVPENKIFVASHAVDNELYSRHVSEEEINMLRQKLGILPGQKVILYLGRLEGAKGLTYLLDAFAMLGSEEAFLLIAGDGSFRAELEDLARKKGISDRTRFAGYVQPDQAVPYYAIATVYVLPSITTRAFKEPWGLVVNEAFNQGLPVIVTDAVGAAAGGLVQDGFNGFIIKERNSDELAVALKMILNDDRLRNRLGSNAREAVAQWDNERMVLGFRQAIDYVMKVHK